MKKIIKIVLLLILICSFASAEDIILINYDSADLDTTIPFPDYLFSYQLPADFLKIENPNGLTVYIDKKGEVIIKINPTSIPSLDDAIELMKETYEDKLTPFKAYINDMEAVAYHYANLKDNMQIYYRSIVYFETDNGTIVKFEEICKNRDEQGKYVGRIIPLVMEDEGESIPEGTKGVCTTNRVNIRKEPSMKADCIGQINKGDKLTVLGTVGVWSKIRCAKGEGWIKTKFIKVK